MPIAITECSPSPCLLCLLAASHRHSKRRQLAALPVYCILLAVHKALQRKGTKPDSKTLTCETYFSHISSEHSACGVLLGTCTGTAWDRWGTCRLANCCCSIPRQCKRDWMSMRTNWFSLCASSRCLPDEELAMWRGAPWYLEGNVTNLMSTIRWCL
jgi:hypothetical protein